MASSSSSAAGPLRQLRDRYRILLVGDAKTGKSAFLSRAVRDFFPEHYLPTTAKDLAEMAAHSEETQVVVVKLDSGVEVELLLEDTVTTGGTAAAGGAAASTSSYGAQVFGSTGARTTAASGSGGGGSSSANEVGVQEPPHGILYLYDLLVDESFEHILTMWEPLAREAYAGCHHVAAASRAAILEGQKIRQTPGTFPKRIVAGNKADLLALASGFAQYNDVAEVLKKELNCALTEISAKWGLNVLETLKLLAEDIRADLHDLAVNPVPEPMAPPVVVEPAVAPPRSNPLYFAPEDPIYLDYNGTTPVDARVMEEMEPFLLSASKPGYWGNASSSHVFGQRAKAALELARTRVRVCLNVREGDEVLFMSNGTETINHCFFGCSKNNFQRGHVITQKTEHVAVLEVCKALEMWDNVSVTYLDVDEHGVVDPESVAAALRPDTFLVSIQHANNETGVVQPIAEIARRIQQRNCVMYATAHLHKERVPSLWRRAYIQTPRLGRSRSRRGTPSQPRPRSPMRGATPRNYNPDTLPQREFLTHCYFHVDASQSVGKLPVDVQALNCDYLTVAGHKVYAPKGVGALYVRSSLLDTFFSQVFTPFLNQLVGSQAAAREEKLQKATRSDQATKGTKSVAVSKSASPADGDEIEGAGEQPLVRADIMPTELSATDVRKLLKKVSETVAENQALLAQQHARNLDTAFVLLPKDDSLLVANCSPILPPFLHGAGQEKKLRASTENVAYCVGLGKACELTLQVADDRAETTKKTIFDARISEELRRKRDAFEARVLRAVGPEHVVVNGGGGKIPGSSAKSESGAAQNGSSTCAVKESDHLTEESVKKLEHFVVLDLPRSGEADLEVGDEQNIKRGNKHAGSSSAQGTVTRQTDQAVPAPPRRLPNTSSLSFLRVTDAKAFLGPAYLGSHVAASAGAACHSDGHATSHVLEAMKRTVRQMAGTVRFTVGRYTTDAEIEEAADAVAAAVSRWVADHPDEAESNGDVMKK
ncbi:unnamed protein product [Amoebophrya sp. A120]|nr:unnamed protein product [Amoebophrya sp. A120]|eukprot:GSA120T00000122001.1